MTRAADVDGDSVNVDKVTPAQVDSVAIHRGPRVGVQCPNLKRRIAIAKLRHEQRRNARDDLRSTAGEDIPSSVFAPLALSPSELAPEGRVPASLESIGITDLNHSAAPEAAAMHLDDSDPYMRDVERETAVFRCARARRYHDRSFDIRARIEAASLPPELLDDVPTPHAPVAGPLPFTPLEVLTAHEERHAKAAWHASRAKGSLERFPRVRDCGMKKGNPRGAKAVATCARSCGLVRKIDLGCGVGRLCVECRAAAATFRKERFEEARGRVLRRLTRDGLMAKHRVDRWGEKFLTLTAPHVDADAIEGAREACESKGIGSSSLTVAARIALVREAWRYFSIKLQKWGKLVRKRCAGRARVAWYRAFEWTPGGDDHGHPHFHLWIVCPFLPRELVIAWWSSALARAGLPDTSPIVDIRDWSMPTAELVKGAKAIKGERPTIVQYVEGWSIVDTIAGTRIPPEVAARLYEALDGARLVQTSRNLLARIVDICPACGCHGSTDVRIVDRDLHDVGELAPSRGPP